MAVRDRKVGAEGQRIQGRWGIKSIQKLVRAGFEQTLLLNSDKESSITHPSKSGVNTQNVVRAGFEQNVIINGETKVPKPAPTHSTLPQSLITLHHQT
jgi:hypothetical protein